MLYQVYALNAQGELVHAGPRRFSQRGPSVIRRYVREWEEWADTIAARSPDCPTAHSRRQQAIIRMHPVGRPELCMDFDARTGRYIDRN